MDASDNLAAREPSFFGDIGNAVKKVGSVAGKVMHTVENVAQNPIVEAAASIIPGGGAVEAAIGAVGKVQNIVEKAEAAGRQVRKFEGALRKGDRTVRQAERHLGALGNVKKFNNAIKHTAREQVRKIAPPRLGRHHRRDLEDDAELSRRDLDAEELFRREYDVLSERDFFDDLD